MVGGLSYIGGRLTAPVSGDEGTDAELADKAKAKTRSAADAVSSGAHKAQDSTAQAAEEAKQQSKGLFSSIRDAFSQPATDRDSATERVHHDTATLQDKAKSAIGEAQDKCASELLSVLACFVSWAGGGLLGRCGVLYSSGAGPAWCAVPDTVLVCLQGEGVCGGSQEAAD